MYTLHTISEQVGLFVQCCALSQTVCPRDAKVGIPLMVRQLVQEALWYSNRCSVPLQHSMSGPCPISHSNQCLPMAKFSVCPVPTFSVSHAPFQTQCLPFFHSALLLSANINRSTFYGSLRKTPKPTPAELAERSSQEKEPPRLSPSNPVPQERQVPPQQGGDPKQIHPDVADVRWVPSDSE